MTDASGVGFPVLAREAELREERPSHVLPVQDLGADAQGPEAFRDRPRDRRLPRSGKSFQPDHESPMGWAPRRDHRSRDEPGGQKRLVGPRPQVPYGSPAPPTSTSRTAGFITHLVRLHPSDAAAVRIRQNEEWACSGTATRAQRR